LGIDKVNVECDAPPTAAASVAPLRYASEATKAQLFSGFGCQVPGDGEL
jgi:hypothetical protein